MQTKYRIKLATRYSAYIFSGESVGNFVLGLTCNLKHTNKIIVPTQAITPLRNEFIGSKPFKKHKPFGRKKQEN